MLQEKVLAELHTHCLSSPPDKKNVEGTIKFLQACIQLFECGTLSHVKVTPKDSAPLVAMEKGYSFFTAWLDALLAAAPEFVPTNPNQKKFISWQTWDLLRIVYFGVRAFCVDYLSHHPGYCIVPVRVSGSSVESLFSQMKHAGGGGLSGTNYMSSRASVLTQRSLHTSHSSGKDYRDVALDVCKVTLRRNRNIA